jgi:putative tricarboxylic transport membrane protein
MLVAVLPGLTLVMGVVLALPFTYSMPITPSVILLTAMYISGTYGRDHVDTVPDSGEPMDAPLLWDGWSMAHAAIRPGRSDGRCSRRRQAELITATVMVTLAVPFAKVALSFDSPEYFAIVLFGFTSVVTLGGGSLANALISLFVGMLISTVGVDEIYGVDRFTFGVGMLRDGIGYLPVMVGAYGLGEVLVRLEQGFASAPPSGDAKVKTRIPTFAEAWKIRMTFLRASLVGVVCGIIPGAGATIASFVAYGVEGQYGERRAELGTGIAEGIVAPQVASTASVGGHMVPLLTLGPAAARRRDPRRVCAGSAGRRYSRRSRRSFTRSSRPHSWRCSACVRWAFHIRPLVKVPHLPGDRPFS